MPELEGKWVACDELGTTLAGGCCHWTSYSLSTSQVHDHFRLVVIFFKKSANDLLDCMHSQPVSAIDERVPPNILGCKRFVVVRLFAEIQFRNASFGDNAAVIRLLFALVQCPLVC
jgi:hypothetical protein